MLGFQIYPLSHRPLSINSSHSHRHLSSFQYCLLLQTFASSLHLLLHVSCQISFSNSDLSVPYLVFKTNAPVSILFNLATNISPAFFFLTTSFFTTPFSLLKSTGTGANLSITNLSTSVFKLAKFDFNEKLVSTCEIFSISAFAA